MGALPELGSGLLGLWVGLIFAAPAMALDCSPSLEVREIEGGDLRTALSVPCQPYAAADVIYGPLAIAEETSLDGTLTLELPRIAGARTLSVTVEGTRLDAAVPTASRPAPPYVSVNWPDGVRWGNLAIRSAESGIVSQNAQQFGFPGRDAPPPMDFLSLPDTAEAVLVVPVRDTTCGAQLRGGVISSDRPLPRTLTVTMPGCERLGEVLTIPLR